MFNVISNSLLICKGNDAELQGVFASNININILWEKCTLGHVVWNTSRYFIYAGHLHTMGYWEQQKQEFNTTSC